MPSSATQMMPLRFRFLPISHYKDHVIDLIKQVCTVSLRTMEIIHQMPETVDHQTEK